MKVNNMSIYKKCNSGQNATLRRNHNFFSIFECKSAKMAITLAGMLSEDKKMGVAKDILPNFQKTI